MEFTPAHRGGQGEPLVLFHGFTDTWETWSELLETLEAKHEVFAPTLPGHAGGPPVPPGNLKDTQAMVDLVEKMLDDAGIETAHLAGNSLGGWVALQLAARGRARSVVGICPAGGWVHGGPDAKRLIRYFTRNYYMLQYGRRWIERTMSRPRSRRWALRDVMAHPERLSTERAVRMSLGAANATAFRELIAIGRKQGLGDLAQVDVPVRIAYGTRDRLIRWPRCYELLRGWLPDAEFVPLEGIGHCAQLDDPELTARTILEVTTRQPAPATA